MTKPEDKEPSEQSKPADLSIKEESAADSSNRELQQSEIPQKPYNINYNTENDPLRSQPLIPPYVSVAKTKSITQSIGFRMLLIGGLVLLMLIPMLLVSSIVDERHSSYNNVLSDISSHWGYEQTAVGPILTVPYAEAYNVTETAVDQNGKFFEIQKEKIEEYRAIILPKEVTLNGAIVPEYRIRGLYQSLVYTNDIKISGFFKKPEDIIKELGKEGREIRIHWDKAFISMGLSDPKGINSISPMQLNEKKADLSPGTKIASVIQKGFHASLPKMDALGDLNFAINMNIKGSTGFKIAPVGELTQMKLSSSWSHPSFYGEILPTSREIGKDGFEASWSVPHLVRSYPQAWVDGTDSSDWGELNTFSFGVNLFEPVTIYTEATRAAKYGILFIALTFLTLALLEVVTKSRPGLLQYAVIGASLALFYLLLIALSEHIGFNKSYAIASSVVIGLNTFYCLFVLSRKALASIITAVLSALYAVLFMALRAEDYALLTGSILLAVALAVTMFFTRNVHKTNEN